MTEEQGWQHRLEEPSLVVPGNIPEEQRQGQWLPQKREELRVPGQDTKALAGM